MFQKCELLLPVVSPHLGRCTRTITLLFLEILKPQNCLSAEQRGLCSIALLQAFSCKQKCIMSKLCYYVHVCVGDREAVGEGLSVSPSVLNLLMSNWTDIFSIHLQKWQVVWNFTVTSEYSKEGVGDFIFQYLEFKRAF